MRSDDVKPWQVPLLVIRGLVKLVADFITGKGWNTENR